MMGVLKITLPQAGVTIVDIRQVNRVKLPFSRGNGWKQGNHNTAEGVGGLVLVGILTSCPLWGYCQEIG